ncbi:hypothetical protein VHUM_00377 [Vanrija humicola]|uniref:chitin deacetylase n=1 Tax=Vanrija humicola TaxID=5417 RepID=A0A7D8V2D0_VANHU|nr:hypothetical protein VHUM_00377 [Vanrija humicola]
MQPADSPVAALFKRQNGPPNPADFATHYPPYGSPPNGTWIPQAWLDKLKSIQLPPNNPPSTLKGCCTVEYPGINQGGMSPDICSFTAGCHTPTDFFDAPNNTFVVSRLTFDDGPGDASQTLYTFLKGNNISSQATHFMIGGNIVGAPTVAQEAFNEGGHIAVHTWSHKYTTALSDEQVLGELGWTMQAIADLTGGRIPAYWRPPYGDVDNRVRTIAKGVFGLETVLWNRDTNDWRIGSDSKYTVDSVKGVLDGWLNGPRSPGILALEHEINKETVDVFMAEYPKFAASNWQVSSVPDAYGLDWYQNAINNKGDLFATLSVGGQVNTNLAVTAAHGATSTSASASESASASGGSSAGASGVASAETSSKTGNVQANKNSGASGVVAPAGALVAAAAALLAFAF